ncbi:MAG: helix-hairpin-helix domain-containing protein [Deltaproteobacteria bacterium]|nr:helix-hairpin-helix domain-containing protein [Deltaproteobacteria bacterium]
MTLLDWTRRDEDRSDTTIVRQLTGLAILAAALIVLYAIKYLGGGEQTSPPRYWAEEKDTITVQLTGVAKEGIFRLPKDADVAELFEAVGLTNAILPATEGNRRLKTGDRVDAGKGVGNILVGSMAVPDRLALGLPVDLNRVSYEGLLLIPHIGPVIAGAILSNRELNGSYESLEELKNLPEIRSKTYEKIKEFFFLDIERDDT